MIKKLTAVLLTVCVLILCFSLLPIHGEEEIYDSVLRLHVVANSDSEEDQSVKLSVRDAILEVAEPLLATAASRDEAERLILESMGLFEEAAKQALIARGCSPVVSLSLSREEYPTKNYESCCFPSGSYLSLRVLIGEAAGQNWWCVLFPPLCLSAASRTKREEAFIEVGLTPDQYRVITRTEEPTYSVRFRLLEVLERAFE